MRSFKPEKMVGWYDVKQLGGTAIRAVLSSIFGSYADKREALAALCEKEVYRDLSNQDDVWIDYMSDTGDGFNSSYSMFHLLSKDYIDVDIDGKSQRLPKGHAVVLGGDQVYPAPSRDEYHNRLLGPLEAASEQSGSSKASTMYAIPGNHDWYDGLTNFVKIFCHGKSIGHFKTVQNRSYFAIQLNPNTWLWGIDIQLQSDVDYPQIAYFNWVAATYMKKNDNVILCTAEPSWVFSEQRKDDTTYFNLEYFEKNCIQGNDLNEILTLAGDLHHYARYSQTEDGQTTKHKITSGGGGAFLHPTHNLPERLNKVHDGKYVLEETFPKKATSRKLTWKNLLFPVKNVGFGLFLSSIHLIMAYALYNTSKLDQHEGTIFTTLGGTEALVNKAIISRLFETFLHSPTSMIILLTFVFGFIAFCDGRSSKYKLATWAGAIHGLLHIVLMLSLFSVIAFVGFQVLKLGEPILDDSGLNVVGYDSTWKSVLFTSSAVFFVGGFLSGVLVGVYLLISSLVLKMHDNEAFSSIKEEGYKNFLRMHIKNNILTIYPIGVKTVSKWRKFGQMFKPHKVMQPELIDKPLVIKLTNDD